MVAHTCYSRLWIFRKENKKLKVILSYRACLRPARDTYDSSSKTKKKWAWLSEIWGVPEKTGCPEMIKGHMPGKVGRTQREGTRSSTLPYFIAFTYSSLWQGSDIDTQVFKSQEITTTILFPLTLQILVLKIRNICPKPHTFCMTKKDVNVGQPGTLKLTLTLINVVPHPFSPKR